VKLLRFEQSDFFQIVRLVSKADQIKLFIVSLFQIFLSFLDLIGVAFFGLIGSVSVAAISSDELSGRTNEIINFIGLSNYSSQSQVVFLGLYAASLMSVKTYAALYFNKKIIFFMSVKSAKLSTNLTSSLFKKSFTDLKKQGSQKLIYTLTTGVDRMIVGVLATSVSLIADFSLLIILVIGLIIISPILTITLLILLGLVSFALYFYIRNKNKRLYTLLNLQAKFMKQLVIIVNFFCAVNVKYLQITLAKFANSK
jgi:hypothetical protein